MDDVMEFAARALLIGLGATAVMDLWGLAAARVLGFPEADYALVGRWIGHMPRGRFVHAAIARAVPIPGERITGWIVHYAVGIVFASLLLAVFGRAWARHPAPLPALVVGLATLAAPFLLMQPGMGAGFAAARTANPWKARLRSTLTHTAFGVGLYGAALVASEVLP